MTAKGGHAARELLHFSLLPSICQAALLCPLPTPHYTCKQHITQIVEIRPEADRFLRLLEILGEWYEKGKLIIFVHSQVGVGLTQ